MVQGRGYCPGHCSGAITVVLNAAIVIDAVTGPQLCMALLAGATLFLTDAALFLTGAALFMTGTALLVIGAVLLTGVPP